MEITLKPIGIVKNTRLCPSDDFWGNVISEIVLNEEIPADAFTGIESFSHLEVIYYFDKSLPKDIVISGRPRGNPDYPVCGIFAQRKKDRPNALGLCTVQLLKHEGRTLTVKYLDAIHGTPVLDIKPVMKEFQPKGEIRQPSWADDLMKAYWK
jgi:tRNA-Thr(GGU) m(6)t(6)A37 methyltransferase TsaA